MSKKSTPPLKTKNDKLGHTIEINRHWFGLLVLYTLSFIGVLSTWGLFVIIGGGGADAENNNSLATGVIGILASLALVIVMLKVASNIYYSNKLKINPLKIQQTTRYALFASKSSVLSLGDIEDVTVHQMGFFAYIFNYGTLNIETAGEQANFQFKYCPKPQQHMKSLMSMKEQYLKNNSNQVID